MLRSNSMGSQRTPVLPPPKHNLPAFSLLAANPEVLHHPIVSSVAAKSDGTLAQVIFAFAHAIGILPLTGTADDANMKDDLASIHLRLSPDVVEKIDSLAG